MSANDELFDAFVQRAIRQRRLSNQVANELVLTLQGANQETTAIVAQRLTSLRSIAPTLAAIADQRGEAYARISDQLIAELQSTAASEASFAVETTNDVLDQPFSAFGSAALAGLFATILSRPADGLSVDDHLTTLRNSDINNISRRIRAMATAGQNAEVIIRALRQGEFQTAARHTIGTVQTLLTHVAAASLDTLVQRNPASFRGLRWTSILDGRTSAVCRARSGEIYRPFEGPRPPAHFRCRSIMVPILVGFGNITEPSYEDWLRRQPGDFIEEVLGPKRAKLFISGDISLDRFIDDAGRTRPLRKFV